MMPFIKNYQIFNQAIEKASAVVKLFLTNQVKKAQQVYSCSSIQENIVSTSIIITLHPPQIEL